MSLLIVGSTSKITQNIVLQLARLNLYKSITISDLLPTYHFHQRYYRLRRNLVDHKLQTQVTLSKITRTDDLYWEIQAHQDILYVTHDYFESVTSKTKLMELTAEFSKNKQNVHFATPLQYDHFGFDNPTQNYLTSQEKVRAINQNASFYRSDIQDGAEVLAYMHKSKGFLEERLFSVPAGFAPRIVSSTAYAESVANGIANNLKGKLSTSTGDQVSNYLSVAYNKDIKNDETCHFQENIRNLLKKYTGLPKVAASQA